MRQVAVEERNGFTQIRSPQHIQIVVTPLMRVRTEHAPAQRVAQRVERVDVLAVQPDLQGGLVLMCGEDAHTHDQADAETKVEFAHSVNILCFQLETSQMCHVTHPQLRTSWAAVHQPLWG